MNALTVTENSEILLNLETIAKGSLELTESHKNTINTVAGQCPLINFDAVYRSRAMVRLYNDSIWWNDEELCDSAGMEYKVARAKPKESSIKCTLYPNPTSDKVFLNFSEIPVSAIDIIITDMQGRELYIDKRILNSNEMSIDTTMYSSGTYIVTVRLDKKELMNEKLEIKK